MHTVFRARNRNLILNWTAGEDCSLIFLKPKKLPLQPLYYSVVPLKSRVRDIFKTHKICIKLILDEFKDLCKKE